MNGAGASVDALASARQERPATLVEAGGPSLEIHPDDARAPLAAFTLGRVHLEDLGAPRDAALAFARARTLVTRRLLARRTGELEALWRRAPGGRTGPGPGGGGLRRGGLGGGGVRGGGGWVDCGGGGRGPAPAAARRTSSYTA